MRVNVGRIVKKRVWTVKTWRMSTKQEIAKIMTEDINSAMEYITLLDQLRDDDIRIAMSSKVITVIESE